MKSFLLYKNSPTVKWSFIPDGIFYEGKLPGEDYALAVCPSENIVILDVDEKNGKSGHSHIPKYSKFKKFIFKLFGIQKTDILSELKDTYNYKTRSGGSHYWVRYTGNKVLLNRATRFGLDLRVGKNNETGNNGGYVKYPSTNKDIRECVHLIKESSIELNKFLENLFSNDREIT